MKEIKIYCNYGVLAAEKRKVYTYGVPDPSAVCSEKMIVFVPDEWELYKNPAGETMIETPWGFCYTINEILTAINGAPHFRALEKDGITRDVYLYTAEKLEEKKEKEERKIQNKKNHENLKP